MMAPLAALIGWAEERHGEIRAAREEFDRSEADEAA